MTAFSVAFDGTRLNNADALTGWTADGVTPSLTADQTYQGTGSIGAQIKTADAGFQYTSASTNMSGRTAIIKMVSGRPGALQGNGMSCRIGSTNANYYAYYLLSATTYPPVGGWQIMAVDPNVSQWRNATVGTPNLGAVTYWSFRANYTANTQGLNTFADAVDTIANGTGLTGLNGTTGPAGAFSNFQTSDEGTEANRWGVVTAKDGILFITGTLTIGASGTATKFASVGETIVFPNHRVTTAFAGLKLDIQNATTEIYISGGLFNGRGALTGSDDTRPRIEVVGTAGVCDFAGHTFSGYEQVIFTSVVEATTCSFTNGRLITPNGANLSGSAITGATGTTALLWNVNADTDGKLDNTSFSSGGAGHAIELGSNTPTSITLRNVGFSSYAGTDGSTGNEALYNNSGKTITVFIVGGTTPSVRNGSGASTILVANPVTVTLTVTTTTGTAIQNANTLVAAAAGGVFPANASVTIANSGTTATVTHTAHGLASNDKVLIKGASHPANRGVFTITVTGANTYTYTMASAPGSNPTGTITSTFVVLSGLTNASGVISMSRVFPGNQPVNGWARKSSASPFYKQGPVSGTVSSSSGASFSALLIADE
jgi:hypothetical protein